MTRVNNDLGDPGYGAIGIWVEAYETANNGTSSTVHVRGGYYNNSPYNIYADTAYVSLNGRGNVSFTTGYPGDHELNDGTYKLSEYSEFTVCERGKTRLIRGELIRDRVVKHTLCDCVLNPSIKPRLIYDNGASQKGKGISFSRNRLLVHLRKYYWEHGNH